MNENGQDEGDDTTSEQYRLGLTPVEFDTQPAIPDHGNDKEQGNLQINAVLSQSTNPTIASAIVLPQKELIHPQSAKNKES